MWSGGRKLLFAVNTAVAVWPRDVVKAAKESTVRKYPVKRYTCETQASHSSSSVSCSDILRVCAKPTACALG